MSCPVCSANILCICGDLLWEIGLPITAYLSVMLDALKIYCTHCKENQPTFRAFSIQAAITPLAAMAHTTVAPLGKSNHADSSRPTA
jgi:hypothetical protein